MSRLTDNDKHFWIFTYARAGWNRTSVVLDSGGGENDEGAARNSVVIYMFGWIVRFYIPAVIKPYREFVDTSKYSWSTNGGYWQTHSKEYGFSLSEGGFFQIYLGAQTHDSSTTKSWCKHLPWTQWRHIRNTVYDKNMNIVFEEKNGKRNKALDKYEIVHAMDKAKFQIKDFDGEIINAEVHVEQRQWKFGEGWFKWLSFFRKDVLRTNIEINLDKEMGPEKGSWKGGTIGLGFDMNTDESIRSAFIRWCDSEQSAKRSKFKVSYIGEI